VKVVFRIMALLLASTLFMGSASALAQYPTDGTADPVIAAAGDIACPGSWEGTDECAQRLVSDLLVGRDYSAVLPLGDNQYDTGALNDYYQAYDPSWGRVRSMTAPVPGNHDCDYDQTCSGYYTYFNYREPWYSYDIDAWHLIALNGECLVAGGCDFGSAQLDWLMYDLAVHPNRCVLAYWHEPRWSSGVIHGSDPTYDAFWHVLYWFGAAIVLNGHEHNYERFAPMAPDGTYDANGVREFVVGTGGKQHYATGAPIPNSQVRNSTTFGVLRLTLHPTSYSWQFVNAPATGTFTDSGSAQCPVRPIFAAGLPGGGT
jgi:hypothetical protein